MLIMPVLAITFVVIVVGIGNIVNIVYADFSPSQLTPLTAAPTRTTTILFPILQLLCTSQISLLSIISPSSHWLLYKKVEGI